MASKVEIANRALQWLGANTITNLTENTDEARQANLAYDPTRLAMLRDNIWNFAIKQENLAEIVPAPSFKWTAAYAVPSDFLRILELENDPEFAVQNHEDQNAILTSSDGSLNIQYVADIEDPNLFDPLFREAFSARLAYELAETITASPSRKEAALAEYNLSIQRAEHADALAKTSEDPQESDWILSRESGPFIRGTRG